MTYITMGEPGREVSTADPVVKSLPKEEEQPHTTTDRRRFAGTFVADLGFPEVSGRNLDELGRPRD